MANPEVTKKRSKLVLPAPQITDAELEEVSFVVCTCLCVCERVCVHTCVCVCVCVQVFVCMYMCIIVFTPISGCFVHVHVHVHVQCYNVHVFLCGCMCVGGETGDGVRGCSGSRRQ